MNFNFQEQYRHLSNIELLLITKQPEKYQSAAVAAASELLQERTVTVEEMDNAIIALSELQEKEMLAFKANPINQASGEVSDIFKALRNRNDPGNAAAWLKVLMVVWTLQLAFPAASIIWDAMQQMNINMYTRTFNLVINAITLLVITGYYVLLYRRMRWGWILCFVGNMIVAVTTVASVCHHLYYLYNVNSYLLTKDLIGLVLATGICLLIWRSDIAAFFNVNGKIKKICFIVGSCLAVLYTIMNFIRIY